MIYVYKQHIHTWNILKEDRDMTQLNSTQLTDYLAQRFFAAAGKAVA